MDKPESLAAVTVERTGPMALIQDSGRAGRQHLGISVGGSADHHAAGWANALLGNPGDAALLEVCLGNLALRFDRATAIAVCGADCGWQLNGRPLANWSATRVPAGSLLECGPARNGIRAYLAIAGGILSDPVWGSRATTVGEGLGGLNGVPLRSGDVLAVPAYDITGRDGKHGAVPAAQQRRYGKALVLRLVPSNQYLQFTAEARRQLFRQVFQVSPQSDRMGVRLDGEALEAPPANMTSEGVALGVVQVPAGGQPIVLMQDRQTIGGYPKIGHVYTVDLDWLAQAVPGTEITFEPGTLEESQALLLQQRELFMSRDSSQFHENGFNGK